MALLDLAKLVAVLFHEVRLRGTEELSHDMWIVQEFIELQDDGASRGNPRKEGEGGGRKQKEEMMGERQK